MQVSPEWYLPLAAASGACFSVMGIAYRLGQPRRVQVTHIVLFCSGIGALFFGWRSWGLPWTEVPWRVTAWGLAAGLTQYATVKFIAAGLRMGPLSPLWCAVMLTFVPATLYSSLALSEGVSVLDAAAVVAAVACVAVASLGQHVGTKSLHPLLSGLRRRLIYAGVLLGVLGANSVASVAMKDISMVADSTGQTYMARYGDVFRCLLYLGLFLALGAEFLLRGKFGAAVRPAAALGLLAGAGSILGLWALTLSAAGPAGLIFTVSSIVSILTTAIVSVLAFGEKADAVWAGTVACGVVAVVLVNWQGIARLLGPLLAGGGLP